MQVIQAGPTAATLRQKALNDSLNTIMGGLGQLEDQKRTQRQEALADQQTAFQLRQAGYEVTPEMVAQSRAQEPSGLAKFFGAKSPEKVDLYANRTQEWKDNKKLAEEEKKFKRQMDYLEMDKTRSEIGKNNRWMPKGSSGGIALTKGQEATDKDYAKQFNSFSTKGIVNTEATLNKLEAIAKELEDDQGFGEASGTKLPIPDMFRSSDAIRRRDDARNAANSTLKELFPGALSDAEREAAAKEYYNDQLGAKENATLIREKVAQLKSEKY